MSDADAAASDPVLPFVPDDSLQFTHGFIGPGLTASDFRRYFSGLALSRIPTAATSGLPALVNASRYGNFSIDDPRGGAETN